MPRRMRCRRTGFVTEAEFDADVGVGALQGAGLFVQPVGVDDRLTFAGLGFPLGGSAAPPRGRGRGAASLLGRDFEGAGDQRQDRLDTPSAMIWARRAYPSRP